MVALYRAIFLFAWYAVFFKILNARYGGPIVFIEFFANGFTFQFIAIHHPSSYLLATLHTHF